MEFNIPIVLSDRWRLPALPVITEELVEKFFIPPLDGTEYSFVLEQKVLDKISQYEDACQRANAAREERIKMFQAEKCKRLGEQLTQVSYPSPDEFSSSDEDVEEKAAPKKSHFEILMPTVLSNSTLPQKLWNGNAAKLELADFEHGADPFDNCELKTIDDLDLLAQVLKSSHVHSNKASPEPKIEAEKNCYTEPYEADEEENIKVIKSISVPDIVKELEAEVNDSKQRRIRNNSHSAESKFKVSLNLRV